MAKDSSGIEMPDAQAYSDFTSRCRRDRLILLMQQNRLFMQLFMCVPKPWCEQPDNPIMEWFYGDRYSSKTKGSSRLWIRCYYFS